MLFLVNKLYNTSCYILRACRYLNHSCKPNCVEVYIGGNSAMVMATRTIEDGEMLTIDYGQATVGYSKWCSNQDCVQCNNVHPMLRDEAVLLSSAAVADDASR
jgi:SAM-dependent MidA family methyltransferase